MAGDPILVIDDNPGNLKLMLFFLSTEGYDLRASPDAAGAFAVLQGFQPKLILLDLHLPGLDGFALARRFRSDPRTKDVPILAVTAVATAESEKAARSAGFDGYLTKPFDKALLLKTVANQLRISRRIPPVGRP